MAFLFGRGAPAPAATVRRVKDCPRCHQERTVASPKYMRAFLIEAGVPGVLSGAMVDLLPDDVAIFHCPDCQIVWAELGHG